MDDPEEMVIDISESPPPSPPSPPDDLSTSGLPNLQLSNTMFKVLGVAIDPARKAMGLTIANLTTKLADMYNIDLDQYCPPKEVISCNTTLCEVVFRFIEDFDQIFSLCGVFIIETQNQRQAKDKNRSRDYEITVTLSLLLYNTLKAKYVGTVVLHGHPLTTRTFWNIVVSKKKYPGLTKAQHYAKSKKLSDSTCLLNTPDKMRVHSAMMLFSGKRKRFHVDSTDAGLMLMCFLAKRNELIAKHGKQFVNYLKDGQEDNRDAVRACVRNVQLHFPWGSSNEEDRIDPPKRKRHRREKVVVKEESEEEDEDDNDDDSEAEEVDDEEVDDNEVDDEDDDVEESEEEEKPKQQSQSKKRKRKIQEEDSGEEEFEG